MSVIVIVDLTAQPERVDALRAFLNPAQIRAYQGNEGVELLQDQDPPQHLLLVERWTTREAYEAYRDWWSETGGRQALEELLEGGAAGMTVRYFDVLETARAARRGDRMEALEDLEEWARRWLTLRAEIRELNEAGLSNEHLGPVIRLHNEELDSIMQAVDEAS